MSAEQSLSLTEPTYRLIAEAQAAFDAAAKHRDTVLRATFAVAGIPDFTVLRIDGTPDAAVLYYTTPNGKPVP